MQHFTRDDIIKSYIEVQIKVFDKILTEHLEDTNFIIDDFDRFVVEDEGIGMPQWDTWDPVYGDKKTNPTET